MKKRILIAVLAIVLIVGVVIAAVWWGIGFKQHAIVPVTASVNIFFDEAQTQELTHDGTIEWGEVHSGNQTTLLYINNTGPANAILQYNVNWEQLPGGWNTSWNYTGSTLPVGETIVVEITLELPEDVGSGEYWWDSGISCTAAT